MWECLDFPGALPDGSDLGGQPAGLIRRMRKAYQVWSAFCDFHQSKSWSEWAEKHPEAWKLKCQVDELRKQHGE